jgi:hypothetical protein
MTPFTKFGLDKKTFGVSGSSTAFDRTYFWWSFNFGNRTFSILKDLVYIYPTHRLLGRVYLIASYLNLISATYLTAWASSIRLNFSWALAFQVFAFAWVHRINGII